MRFSGKLVFRRRSDGLRDADGGRQTRLARPHLPRRVFAEVSKRFFFEKRRKRPLLFWSMAVKPSWPERIKVFFASFLFTKKKTLFSRQTSTPYRTAPLSPAGSAEPELPAGSCQPAALSPDPRSCRRDRCRQRVAVPAGRFSKPKPERRLFWRHRWLIPPVRAR